MTDITFRLGKSPFFCRNYSFL